MIVGLATSSPLRRRVERVVAAEPGVRVAALDKVPRPDLLGIDGPVPEGVASEVVVDLPGHPVSHLADLLSAKACSLAGTDAPDLIAYTVAGSSLGSGTAVTFPPPVGALWAERRGDRLVAPHAGPLAAVAVSATGLRGAVRLGVVDHADFMAAIAMAAPLLAIIRGESELEATEAAGLEIAEFVATG